MLNFKWSLAAMMLFVFSHATQAQPGPDGFGLPEVGSALPDVTVFDAEGAEFSTKTLQGHYSVLVFGCLT